MIIDIPKDIILLMCDQKWLTVLEIGRLSCSCKYLNSLFKIKMKELYIMHRFKKKTMNVSAYFINKKFEKIEPLEQRKTCSLMVDVHVSGQFRTGWGEIDVVKSIIVNFDQEPTGSITLSLSVFGKCFDRITFHVHNNLKFRHWKLSTYLYYYALTFAPVYIHAFDQNQVPITIVNCILNGYNANGLYFLRHSLKFYRKNRIGECNDWNIVHYENGILFTAFQDNLWKIDCTEGDCLSMKKLKDLMLTYI